MKFRHFILILESHGFELDGQSRSPAIAFTRVEIGGRTRVVVVACHSENDDIKRGTLSSMIRQSGLPKRAFRR